MSSAVAGTRGPQIPGFRWVRPLGQGGFADVFLYRQELPSRDVAIKVVRAKGDERGTLELHREADAMTLLAGHPAVVELHGVGTTSDGRAYLVMEYCPVADLLTQVRARPMSLETALDTMIKVCGVVEMFHRQGYVHRDIKPSNIMLDAYGKPVLADFGVASKIGKLEVGAFDGFSVLWAPPEQQDINSPAVPTQDVWALASTMWTFITGRSPFEDPIGDNSAASIANRVQRGRMTGKAMRGNKVNQGDYGLVALEPAWITSNQIEAARVAMTRYIKRGGKVWIKIFPDKPVTEKPAGTRMGSGKGSPEYWVAVVKPGRVLFELADVNEETAREALRLASHKLPIRCKFVKREELDTVKEGDAE